MQLHQFSKSNNRSKKRVGRGGKRGTYSGKGLKGQKSRAGRKMRPEWRDALKRIPKRRGYAFKGGQNKSAVLNLERLNSAFGGGELITSAALFKKGLINKISGRLPEIKILGRGELDKKLSFKGMKVSKSAKEKIEKAGGEII